MQINVDWDPKRACFLSYVLQLRFCFLEFALIEIQPDDQGKISPHCVKGSTTRLLLLQNT